MRCYYRNSKSCGANRREFEDQSAIKGKLDQMGEYQVGLSFRKGARALREERKRERNRKRRRRRRRRRRGKVCILMGLYGFVWNCMEY